MRSNGMPHTIVFLSGNRVQRSISWDGGLETAKKYAVEHLGIRKANRCEIRDPNGKIVWQEHARSPASAH